jgi:hypothetical protein
MDFIKKLTYCTDVDLLNKDLENLLTINPWPQEDFDLKLPGNQISVTHRPNHDIWMDGTGNLYDQNKQVFIATEDEFTEFNPYIGEYTKKILSELAELEGVKFGRIRYMKLEPKKGLSIHKDFNVRYHFALKTNSNALFGEKVTNSDLSAKCYHIPADGHAYKVDTTREHFVYNGGWEDRIHLVICEA